MTKEYTPTEDTYDAYPVNILSAGDDLDEATLDPLTQDLYNRIAYLKKQLDEKDIDNSALIENLNNNVGGEVTGTTPPSYTDSTIVSDGDSHHTGIEKLDQATAQNINDISANGVSTAANLSKISYMADKIDINATNSAPFDFLNNNFIDDGERLKAIVEKFDRYMLGMRRSAEFGYGKGIDGWAYASVGTNTFYVHGYDTFYDLEKLDQPLTTATIDNEQQQASGADQYITWLHDTGGPIIDEVLFTWEISSGGTIEVRFHADGETTWGSMEVFSASKDNFQAVAVGGSNLVIKIKLIGTTKLYNMAYIAKGT